MAKKRRNRTPNRSPAVRKSDGLGADSPDRLLIDIRSLIE
jgi:hypothetical protein